MRKLGDQWIEIIDGKEHMVKAVEGENCQGCMYSSCQRFAEAAFWQCRSEGEICPFDTGELIIKDLGILNDGCLQCPFCGEYPATDVEGVAYCNSCGCDIDLDKWNRRV